MIVESSKTSSDSVQGKNNNENYYLFTLMITQLTAEEQYSAKYSACDGIPSGIPADSKPLPT